MPKASKSKEKKKQNSSGSGETEEKKKRKEKRKEQKKLKDAKKKAKEQQRKQKKEKTIVEDSDSSNSSSSASHTARAKNSFAALNMEVAEPTRLPGALLKPLVQPTNYTLRILAEERPDLCSNKSMALAPQEADLFERHLRNKADLQPEDCVYQEDNMNEDERKYKRYQVQMKYNEGRYTSAYVVKKQTCNKNEPIDAGVFILKTGARKNSATLNTKIKRELRVLQELGNIKKSSMSPLVIDHGKVCDMPYIVMTMFDHNLSKVRENLGGKFKMSSVFYIAQEALTCIWDLHSKNYIHRDIKPTNFCVGCHPIEHRVCMIDFGETIQKGKKIKLGVPDAATLPFWSVDCHRKERARERTDLESWYYMIIEFACPHVLSWRDSLNEVEVETKKIKFWSELGKVTDPKLRSIGELIAAKSVFGREDYVRIRSYVQEGLDGQLGGKKYVAEWIKGPK